MASARNLTTLGITYCTCSAVAYTAYNVFGGDVSKRYDPALVNGVQASVPSLIALAYLIWQAVRGRRVAPPWKEALALVLLGIPTAIGGVLYFWTMSVVGVAVAGTLQTGTILAVSAMLGLVILRERVSWLQWVAIGGITVSAALFSMGPQTNDAAASAAGETTAGQVGAGGVIASSESAAGPQNVQPSKSAPSLKDRLLGVAMCILSGIAMAALTVGIRKTVTGATSPLAVVFLINVMGVVVCAPWCIHSLGVAKIMSTPSHDFGVMLLTGAMNFAGFFLVTMGLKLLAVVSANVINNGLSSAMTAAVGILWLAEAYNTAIILGLVFSIGGTLLISLVAPPEEQPAAAGQLDSAAASP